MISILNTLRQRAARPWPERVQAALAVLSPSGNPVPVLVQALTDDDPDLRLLAVEALAELEPHDKTLPALIAAPEYPDRLVRIAAVEQVARFGPNVAVGATHRSVCWLRRRNEIAATHARPPSAIGKTQGFFMARSEKNVTRGYLNSSATQQRKNSPRMRCGRLAIDWSLRRVNCLSSSFVLA